ncbi:hypothetical protein [uncultured Roseibium sp.]|uniref:hypothetical protein n=1 Tax=uncultured Roseibium sp. TaxID=1936171 RepID=UPI0032172920
MAALKSSEIPHSDTLLKALALLDKSAARRARLANKSPKDDAFKSVAKCLRDRHVIILFQDSLGTAEINARGALFNPGTLRTITHKNDQGDEVSYKAYMGGVIKLSTCVVGSYIATAALLAHEFWHIRERELRPNKLKEPEAVALKGNDVFSGSENFADYVAGREVTNLGFTERSIFKSQKYISQWGSRWYDSESYAILIQKFRLYHQARLAMQSEAASRSFLWKALKSTKQVDLTLGLTVEGTVTKKGKVTIRWRQASGIRNDGYRIRRLIPDVCMTSLGHELHWKGRRFIGHFKDPGHEEVHFEGEIDKRGRMVSYLNAHYVSSSPGTGRREQSIELTSIPLARYAVGKNTLMCFELIGPDVRDHLKKLTWTSKMWNNPKPGSSGRKVQTTTTMKRILWDDLDLIPYLQVVFYIEGDTSFWNIKGKFAPPED